MTHSGTPTHAHTNTPQTHTHTHKHTPHTEGLGNMFNLLICETHTFRVQIHSNFTHTHAHACAYTVIQSCSFLHCSQSLLWDFTSALAFLPSSAPVLVPGLCNSVWILAVYVFISLHTSATFLPTCAHSFSPIPISLSSVSQTKVLFLNSKLTKTFS